MQRILVLLAAVGALLGASGRAEPPARVTAGLVRVPLRAALAQVYAGSGFEVRVAPDIPDARVTAEIRGVPRGAALRCLLRASGIPRLTARETGAAIEVTQLPAPSPGPAEPSVSAGIAAAFGAAGPGGIQSTTAIRTTRRLPAGSPAYLGGIDRSSAGISRSGVPYLPLGSTLRSRTSTTSGTFVTVTILPEPEPERPPLARK